MSSQVILLRAGNLVETISVDPEIRGGRPTLPGTGYMIADLLAELSDSRGVTDVAERFDLDAKKISDFLDALSSCFAESMSTKTPSTPPATDNK